jgi:hypothetical protein
MSTGSFSRISSASAPPPAVSAVKPAPRSVRLSAARMLGSSSTHSTAHVGALGATSGLLASISIM